MGERLTKAQRKFLALLEARPSDAPVVTELSGFSAAMAARLAERQLVARYFRGFGQWAWTITDAGRAALSPTPPEKGTINE